VKIAPIRERKSAALEWLYTARIAKIARISGTARIARIARASKAAGISSRCTSMACHH